MMFCSKCGTQVADDACFCYKCGYALTQNASQPNASQTKAPQENASRPAASYSGEPKKGGVSLIYPDGRNEFGDLYVSATEIRFVKKSRLVMLAFGHLGNRIEKGEERLCLKVSDIADGRRTTIGLNHFVYQITMNNGDVYNICVNLPKTLLNTLEEVVEHR